MTTWTDNGNGTVSFDTNDLGIITVGADFVYDTPIENITTDALLYHEYDELNSLGIPVGSIDPALLQASLAAYPTPFGREFAGPGWVTHEQVSPDMIINYTATTTVFGLQVPLHTLQPGIVVREIVIEDGVYAIRTYGIGQGIFPGTNQALGDAVWTYADSVLVDDLVMRTGLDIMSSIPANSDFFGTFVGRQFLNSSTALVVQNAGIFPSDSAYDGMVNVAYSAFLALVAYDTNLTADDLRAIESAIEAYWAEESQTNMPFRSMRDGLNLYNAIFDAYNEENGTDYTRCFLAGTPIDMWDGSQKPIEDIRADDIVVSYDPTGVLVPGRVTRTQKSLSAHILDVFGLMVTPAHVTFCADGRFKGGHVPMIDILRSDGALMHADGTLVRAATGCKVGSTKDQFVHVVAGRSNSTGSTEVSQSAQIRLGTRFIMADGVDVCLADLIDLSGGRITTEGLIETDSSEAPQPFLWTFSSALPKPEDYVLQRSDLTLAEIYQMDAWEDMAPQTTAPYVPGIGLAQPASAKTKSRMRTNQPLSMQAK